MENMNLVEKASIAKEIIEKIGCIPHNVEIQTYDGGKTLMNFFPTSEEKEATVKQVIHIFGSIKKEEGGSIKADNDDVRVRVFGAMTCNVIGEKEIEQEEVIYTGRKIKVKIPVYDCAVLSKK